MPDESVIHDFFGHQRAKVQEHPPADSKTQTLGLWTASNDFDKLPQPRDWLLGNTFCRGFLSSLIAEGGTGKTALRLAQCLALATGLPLTGEHVFARTRVAYISLEDDADELRRRMRAALIHHGLDYDQLGDWLWLATPSTDWEPTQEPKAYTIAYTTRFGELKVGAFLTKLQTALRDYQFGLVVIDPFVKLHSLNENSNPEIDYVCRVLSTLAGQYHCAIDVPHHTAKLIGDGGSRSNRTRGASSFRDAARLLYTLAPMSSDEAAEMNIDEKDRLALVRLDPAKLNITTPAADATWFKLCGVNIGNGNDTYPHGDDVQTVEPWNAPNIWKIVTPSLVHHIFDLLEAGLADGRKYGIGNVGDDRQAWRLVQAEAPTLTDTQAKIVIRKWQDTGLIGLADYTDPTKNKVMKGVVVQRRPG
jgi:hypothetical protein